MPLFLSYLAQLSAMLVMVGLMAACGGPVAIAPTATVGVVEPSPSPDLALHAEAPTEVPSTPTPSAPTPTSVPQEATATSAPTTTPEATVLPAGAAVCGEAHAATLEASTDLNEEGRLLAPPLERFNLYRLDLDLDRATATISGTQTLEFTNRTSEPLPDLLFHLYPNLPDFAGSVELGCVTVDGVAVDPVYEEEGWIVRLPLETAVPPNGSIEVTLQFRTTAPQGDAVTYGAFGAADNLWTMASFYPVLAIRVDGAWDTLRPNGWGDFVNSDSALYHVRATVPVDHEVIATGEVTATCGNVTCMATIAAGPQRDFAMALAQGWDEARQEVGETVVVSAFPPDQRAAGELALELGADALGRFSEAFGPYPYTEFDIMPIPARGFAGVEYPGLIMIGDRYYTDPDNPRMDLQDVVVHEVAHMWWYAVVGNDVLREPWLDEGLTSYSAEYLYTEWSSQGEKPVTEARQAQIEQAGVGAEPIDRAVAEYGEPGIYVTVVYGRAPLFFVALREELGDDLFFQLLQEHYRRNAFGWATTDGFKALAEEIAGRELDALFQEWFTPDSE